MGVKKSNFTGSTTIPDTATFDYVINGTNLKITKADLLAALGVAGTIAQDGAISGTPILDVDGTVNKIRNLEALNGITIGVSAENGASIGSNLLAGDNVSITPTGTGTQLEISAAVGEVANTVIVQDIDDLPAASGGIHTLEVASYVIKGNIDLGSDVIVMAGGSQIIGDTATLSSITTASAQPTITVSNGGFAACAISGNGGFEVNNTGGGAAIRVQDTDTICAIRRLLTRNAGTALEINSSNVLLDGWTIIGASLGGTVVNGMEMTGTANSGPIINNFNPIGLTGKGIYINGDITSRALRINDANIDTVAGIGVEIAAGAKILGMSFTGDAISSGANGMKIAGVVAGGLSLDKTNILSYADDGMDITGGTLSSFIASSAGITAIAAGKFGLVGDASSANITTGAGIVTSSFIDGLGAGGGALSGITKGDIDWSFNKAGPKITDSTNIGGLTLDAPSTTVILEIGDEGTVAAYADAGGGLTTVTTSSAHGLVANSPVSITGTTAYNGLYLITSASGSAFNIDRAFVSNEATGVWDSGWYRVNGSTTDIATTERFVSIGDNLIQSLDKKTIPIVYNATLSGQKTGSGQDIFEMALFIDRGEGMTHINGITTFEADNRARTAPLVVPTEVSLGDNMSLYIRNTEAFNNFETSSLSISITKS